MLKVISVIAYGSPIVQNSLSKTKHVQLTLLPLIVMIDGILAVQSMHQYLVLDEECEMDSDETELKYLFDAVDGESSSDSSSSSSSSSDKKDRLM